MSQPTPLDGVIENVTLPRALIRGSAGFGDGGTGECVSGDLIVKDGAVRALQPSANITPQRLVLPYLTEPHVHLDKCHTVDRLPAVGGDLHAAIAAQYEDKQNWTDDDVRARASRGLAELAAAGCRLIRSHVDWEVMPDPEQGPLAWSVLTEMVTDSPMNLSVQLAPLVSPAQLTSPGITNAIARQAAGVKGALGCFIYAQPERKHAVEEMFRAADAYGLPLDFHVDEGLDPDLDGLELIADTALALRFEGPVLCGHACNLMNFHGDTCQRVLDKVARAGLSVVTLPTTNLYLQGRSTGTPDRRGLTRIKELRQAGVNVVVGTDNVRDAFCPIGKHDPLTALAQTCLAAHLDPPLGDWLPLVTTGATTALGHDPVFIDGARVTDLIAFDAPSPSELLAAPPKPVPLTSLITGAM